MKAKRFLIALLTACLLPIFTLSAETIELNEKYEQSLDMLISLDIMEGYTLEDWSKTVTRAEFAKMLCNIVFDGGEAWGSGTEFEDITQAHGYYSAVYALNDMNIMIGYNNRFEPDKNIVYEEAVTSLISLLGYSVYVDGNDSYPNEYLKLANSISLDKNMLDKSSHELNLAETAMLIYNALHTDMVVLDMNSKGFVYQTTEDVTPLVKYMDIYEGSGLFEANSLSGILGDPVSEGNIMIDGEMYTSAEYNELMGCIVDFYYKDVDEKAVVYMLKNKKVQTLEILAQDIYSFENNIYYYEIEGNSRVLKAGLEEAAKVIYNGRVPRTLSGSDLYLPESGKINLIDNNGDEKYDTIFVWNYETYVVQNIEIGENIAIVDFYNRVFELTADDEYTLKVYKDGLEADLSQVTKWNVLSVAQSEENDGERLVTIHISDRRVTGQPAYGDDYVKIDGVEYPLSVVFNQDKKGGIMYDFWLDAFGNVTCFDPYSSDLKAVFYGVLTDMNWVENSDDPPTVRIYTENGEFVEYKLAKSMKIDGEKYKDSTFLTQFDNALRGELTGVISQMIAYKLNKDGEITYIDTLEMGEKENKKDNLTASQIYQPPSIQFLILGRTFSDKYALSMNTRVFQVPVDTDGEILTDMGYEKYYKLVNGVPYNDHYDNYTVQFYNVNEAGSCKLVLQYIQLGGTDDLTTLNGLFSVKTVSQSLNENDEEVYMLEGYLRDGTFSTYEVGEYGVDAAKTLKRGDIVSLAVDSDNKVQSITARWYANEENNYYLTSNIPYQSRYAFGRVSAVDYDESVFRVCYVENAADPLSNDNSFVNNMNGWTWDPSRYDTKVMIYNRRDKTVTPGTKASIRVGQEVVMYKMETAATSVIIIE